METGAGAALQTIQNAPVLLKEFHLQSARPEERAHPVRKLARIRGVSLLQSTGQRRFEAEDLRAFSERVIESNPGMLAFSEGAGRRVFDRVRFEPTLAIVDYHQEARCEGGLVVPVDGSVLRFFYNLEGQLTQVANLTYLDVDGLPAPRLDESAAEDAVRKGGPIYVERAIDDDDVEFIDWNPESVAESELVVLPRAEGHRLAWRLLVTGQADGRAELRQLWIDAGSGALLKEQGTEVHSRPVQSRLGLKSIAGRPPSAGGGGTLPWPKMVGHWALDGSGVDSRGIQDMVWAGGTLPSPPPASGYSPGILGQSLNAAGMWQAKIRIPQSFACPIDYSYTMMLWVKPSAQDDLDAWYFMVRPNALGVGEAALGLSTGGRAEVFQRNVRLTDSASLPVGQWTHLAMTYLYDSGLDNGQLRLYKNGQLIQLAAGVPPFRNEAWGINETDGVESFQGCSGVLFLLDDLGLANYAFADSEIAAIYNGGIAGLDMASFLPMAAQPPSPAYTATGRAIVFDPHPNSFDWRQATNGAEATLHSLDAGRFTVSGEHVMVKLFPDPSYILSLSGWDGSGVYQCSRDYRALLGEPFPASYQIADPQVYYGVGLIRGLMSATGFGAVLDSPVRVYSIADIPLAAYYQISTKSICLIGEPVNLDLEILLHEYGHALQDDFEGPGNIAWGCVIGGPGSNNAEGEALGEGGADFLAANALNEVELLEYSLFSSRRVDGDHVRGSAFSGCHRRGQVWSGAWWNVRERLGSAKATQLGLQWNYYVLPSDDFDSALETCVLQADQDLFGGLHEDVLRRVFSIRGIFGAAGFYPWASSLPFSQRPYSDSLDETQSRSVPGAISLHVTFDAYTKARYEPDAAAADLIHVMDGTGAPIAASPFIARELQNRTVTVPGDTVQIRLQSVPNDTFVAAGYRVINIAAVDPGNQPPLAVLEASQLQGMAPVVIDFDVSSSFDPDGSVIAYTLDPGDGSAVIQLDPEILLVSHIYHRDGMGPLLQAKTFNAVLTVTDNKGDVGSAIVQIQIEPYAEGRVRPTSAPPPRMHECTVVNGVLDCQ